MALVLGTSLCGGKGSNPFTISLMRVQLNYFFPFVPSLSSIGSVALLFSTLDSEFGNPSSSLGRNT